MAANFDSSLDVNKADFKRDTRWLVRVGVSRAHVHLTPEHIEALFGPGHGLTLLRELGQAGEFAAKETVNVVGSKGVLQQVRIIGPARAKTQVELARTDTYVLGIDAPLRHSGDVEGTPGAVLIGPKGVVVLNQGCIIAKAHIHLLAKEAEKLELAQGDEVVVLIKGEKKVCYYDVKVRVVEKGMTEFHIDTDEANAAFVDTGDLAMIRHKEFVIKDKWGNTLDVSRENVKFIQGKKPDDPYVQEAIHLLHTVFEYPESIGRDVEEKLLAPERVEPNRYYLFTAVEGGRVFGIASFYWMPRTKIAYFEHLGIIPEYQDRGIGSFLFNKVIAILEKNHPEIEGVLFEVRLNKEHLDDRKHFFLNLGAIPVDTSFYPSDQIKLGENILLMFKPETAEARLNTATMELALQTLSRIL
ncbi:phosphate propanoyltransferase/2-acylglycerol O-acyltransferase [Acididesulfobacillus acetoxydans]|uniref:Phosphate propanoyltransferase n=1 Tax=Acididesulfobacillus acetoxydans TaxID=1561005 RepID=A0A8S0XCS4_9FIRM|nr:phosphate propanoyltransferase [Acididesulfobacillus acetoxydans]CAA7602786.1 phosphate propanoyltransferase/2-acylglycerol O-acyltransferase [Acididesulfobacillus acetoxydans]CEJ06357.1 Phosphate propanoyltransferase [Acididesulfobacillus acetoxydans]